MSRLNQRIKLPDNRLLGYDEYGVADGKPLFYFHGTPSCRVECTLFGSPDLVRSLNLRLIVPDRPGMALSDFKAGRRIGDWHGDVLALAGYLGLERFSVLGYSGGGPYALACALAIPERLTRVGVVSGAGPFDQPGLADGIHPDSRRFMDLSSQKPWLAHWMLRMMGMMARIAGRKMLANAMAALPEPDRQVLRQPAFQQTFLKMICEALRPGPQGAQRDTYLMVSPWDFDPHAIHLPVLLWHGDADCNAPPAMGRYVADAIPNSRLKMFPGEGHLSLFVKYAAEIFAALAN